MRFILLAVAVFMMLTDQTEGAHCSPCDPVTCAEPTGCGARDYVKDSCGCCDVCGTKFGQPCYESTPRCARDMWCIEVYDNAEYANAKRTPGRFFSGVCGKIKVPKQCGSEIKVQSTAATPSTQGIVQGPPGSFPG